MVHMYQYIRFQNYMYIPLEVENLLHTALLHTYTVHSHVYTLYTLKSHSMIQYMYMHLLQLLRGNVGLFFTNQPRDDVISWFQSYSQLDHARTGCQATDDIIRREGPLEQFPHSMEPHLSNLGRPTTLKKGIHVHVHVYTCMCIFAQCHNGGNNNNVYA